MNEIKGFYNAAIHPDRINIYYEPFSRRSSRGRSEGIDLDPLSLPAPQPKQFKDNSHKGRISPTAFRKISRAVSYLTYLVPHRRNQHTPDGRQVNFLLSFITLTLSSTQIHSDNEIKTLILEPFLNEMRKRWHVVNYIWRAERQENGNIHFHILSDRFIWWNELRNSWNYFQERLGYVTRYRLAMQEFHLQGFRYRPELEPQWPRSAQINAWRAGIRTDWNSPNSTDVHALERISSVRSYITKYITKTDGSAPVQGRLWGCSLSLSNLKGAVEFADGEIASELNCLLKSHRVKTYRADYYTVICFNSGTLQALGLFLLLRIFNEYLSSIFQDYRPPSLFP